MDDVISIEINFYKNNNDNDNKDKSIKIKVCIKSLADDTYKLLATKINVDI